MQSICRALCMARVVSLFGFSLLGSAQPALADSERPVSVELRGGLLARDAGFQRVNGSAPVRVLQLGLRRLGHRPGPVDGLFGPLTEAAVVEFQRARALAADGLVGPKKADEPDLPLALAVGLIAFGAGLASGLLLDVTRSRPADVRHGVASRSRPADVRHGVALPSGLAPSRPAESPERPRPGDVRGGAQSAGHRREAMPDSDQSSQIGLRAFGYVSGGDSGKLRAQDALLARECRERRWSLVGLARESEPANGKGQERPALDYALEQIAAGEAGLLLVARLEQLCRSVAELPAVITRLARVRARFICLEPAIDSATEAGQAALQVVVAASARERERRAESTRKGLAAARASRPTSRPTLDDRPELKRRILALRADGLTLQGIAEQLNRDNVPTLRGGREWRPSSIQAALGYKRPKLRSHATPPSPGNGDGDNAPSTGACQAE